MTLRKTRKRIPKEWLHAEFLWSRFDFTRCTDVRGALALLQHNFVSTTVSAPCTLGDVVKRMAETAQGPIAIGFLGDELRMPNLVRGKVITGYLGDEIDKIAMNYPNMRWWISDKGLNMAVVPPERTPITRFNELAGSLTIDRWDKTGSKKGLSPDSLFEIAKRLDEEGFELKAPLQPAEWDAISKHNQKNPRKAVTTFDLAARDSRFTRSVRRCIYRAREKQLRAVAIQSQRLLG